MEKIKNFVKKEIVFVIAAALAVVSSFFVPISAAYIEYIDFKVIALLFCLMSVIKGFMHTGLFDVMANKILTTFKTPRSLALALILMTFFSAMLVTNDVALIAFVPLCIGLYEKTDEKSLVFVVVMQTIAANLGSMLTPIGNRRISSSIPIMKWRWENSSVLQLRLHWSAWSSFPSRYL